MKHSRTGGRTYKVVVVYNIVMNVWVDNSTSVEYTRQVRAPRQQYLVASGQTIEVQTQSPDVFEIERQIPIFVKITDGSEELVCSTRKMKVGKPYRITWEGKDMAVVKTPTALEFYEAVSES